MKWLSDFFHRVKSYHGLAELLPCTLSGGFLPLLKDSLSPQCKSRHADSDHITTYQNAFIHPSAFQPHTTSPHSQPHTTSPCTQLHHHTLRHLPHPDTPHTQTHHTLRHTTTYNTPHHTTFRHHPPIPPHTRTHTTPHSDTF